MSAVLKIKPHKMTISEIAAAAIEKADGDVVKASKIMELEVLANEEKYRALMDPLLASACYSAVSSVQRESRANIWTAPNYTAGGNGARVHALASGNLLLFPLPGGKRLGEATKADVLEAAEFYGKQSADMAIKSKWLSLIGNKLVGKQTVAKIFTDESLRKLQERVKNA